MYQPGQGAYPQGGNPQGGYPTPGAFPQGGYPPSGNFPQGGYPPPGPPLQGGYNPQGVTPQGSYPPQGQLPKVGGYPPEIYLPPPQPGFQPGYPSEVYTMPSDDNSGLVKGGEDDDFKNFDFSEKSIRRAFIRKVYAILMAQLLVTLGAISLFTFHTPTKLWVMWNTMIIWIALIASFVCVIAISCFQDARRKAPGNFIFLGVFTLAESLLLGVVSSVYDTEAVVMAVGITAAVCFALTLFAMQTKYDITVIGGGLSAVLIVLILFGLIKMFFPKNDTLTLVYASIGALVFALYIVYDTQLMMSGNHKYTISPEEYIFAALNLYLDVINLFIFILRIIGISKS